MFATVAASSPALNAAYPARRRAMWSFASISESPSAPYRERLRVTRAHGELARDGQATHAAQAAACESPEPGTSAPRPGLRRRIERQGHRKRAARASPRAGRPRSGAHRYVTMAFKAGALAGL